MSGLPPSNFELRGQQQPPTSDSRLLDAAETLVTLQSVSGRASGSGSSSSKTRAIYLTPHHQQRPFSSKMSPQPPTPSASLAPASMGPPPPPSNVTYVLINQAQPQTAQSPNLMRPPTEPPPRRGRGRGRGRGGANVATPEPSSNRGRGRGRGRGSGPKNNGTHQVTSSQASQFHEPDPDQDDDMGETDPTKETAAIKEDATFMVGNHLELRESIFDEILNKKKLELMTDPEIMSLFAKHQQKLSCSKKK